MFALLFSIVAATNSVNVDTDASSMIFVAGNVGSHQDALGLSMKCKAAISLQSSVMNDLCGAHCMGSLEAGFVPEADFYSQCTLDRRMDSMLTMSSESHISETTLFNEGSRCYAAGMPFIAGGPFKTQDVAYPSRCQQLCQETDGCVYSSVSTTPGYGTFQCSLYSQKALIDSMLRITEDECRKIPNARWSECSFGSAFCAVAAEKNLGVGNSLPKGSVILAAPSKCYAAAIDTADNVCIALDLALRSVRNGNKTTGADGKEYSASGETFHSGHGIDNIKFRGMDRILGFGKIYDMDSWKQTYGSDPQVSSHEGPARDPTYFAIDMDAF